MERLNKIKYSVIAVGVILVLALGVGLGTLNVKAQDTGGGGLLDKILYLYLQTKIHGIQPVEIPTSSEQTLGYSERPDVVVTKKVDYDDITTDGVDITNPVSGDFYVENLVIETGTLTIASGTALQIITEGDDYGTSTPLFSTQVSAFPRSTTMDLNTAIGDSTHFSGYASSTQRVILEDGSNLAIKCTTADCKRTTSGAETGTGYLTVTATLKRVQNYGNIYE